MLLKNEGNLLPLKKDVGTIAVIGPNAYDPHVLVANYFGIPSRAVTPLDGIRAAVSRATKVLYTDGCKLQGTKTDGLGRAGNLSEAVSVAARADVVVLCLGLSADIEGEQGDAGNSEAAGDKIDLKLPGLQQRLMEMIVALGKPTVLCVLAGSALDLTWAQDHVPAIVYAWYPGGEGGSALADVLFGDVSPAGRLPITFPRSMDDVPYFGSYAMKGRTYRYAEKTPLYPFGYGLSYTTFAYSEVVVSSASVRAGDTVTVSATVKNVGKVPSDEVVQLYVKDLEASCVVPAARSARLHARASWPRRGPDNQLRPDRARSGAGQRRRQARARARPFPRDDRRQPTRRPQRRADRTISGRDRVRRRRLKSDPLAPRSSGPLAPRSGERVRADESPRKRGESFDQLRSDAHPRT